MRQPEGRSHPVCQRCIPALEHRRRSRRPSIPASPSRRRASQIPASARRSRCPAAPERRSRRWRRSLAYRPRGCRHGRRRSPEVRSGAPPSRRCRPARATPRRTPGRPYPPGPAGRCRRSCRSRPPAWTASPRRPQPNTPASPTQVSPAVVRGGHSRALSNSQLAAKPGCNCSAVTFSRATQLRAVLSWLRTVGNCSVASATTVV